MQQMKIHPLKIYNYKAGLIKFWAGRDIKEVKTRKSEVLTHQ